MKILRALLVTIIFILEIPAKLAMLLYFLIESIISKIKGELTFSEYWEELFHGCMIGWEINKYFIRTGRLDYDDEDEEL